MEKKQHVITMTIHLNGIDVFRLTKGLEWPDEDGSGVLPQQEVRCEAHKMVKSIPNFDWEEEMFSLLKNAGKAISGECRSKALE